MIDRIYFLTLNDSLKRKDNVEHQILKLNELGFDNCEMFKNYKWPKAIAKHLKETFFPHLGEGIFSCTAGQYAIMNDALSKGYEYIMVVEDDVDLTPTCIEYIKEFEVKYKNLDFDCVKLFHFPQGVTWEELNDYKYDWVNNELFRVKKLPKECYVWGNQCVIVNRNYMKAYIDYFDSHIDVADIPATDHDEFIDKYNLKIYIYNDVTMIKYFNFGTSLQYKNSN